MAKYHLARVLEKQFLKWRNVIWIFRKEISQEGL
ncbi:hypothetical protein SAMN05192529_104170 [Arachidicoccus rhizosphaerae]|uniref:Uncharacterized protein n=1 Tax=Arachidicoccus rhizosphaerae TaxID=551991 RepID=A0A1H3X4V0_9BACT|nr:hypothetical protein SAMN05192529_104170 [Arachidicoccus rhizosphaerae]